MHSINRKIRILVAQLSTRLVKRPSRPEAPRTTLLYFLYSSVKDWMLRPRALALSP